MKQGIRDLDRYEEEYREVVNRFVQYLELTGQKEFNRTQLRSAWKKFHGEPEGSIKSTSHRRPGQMPGKLMNLKLVTEICAEKKITITQPSFPKRKPSVDSNLLQGFMQQVKTGIAFEVEKSKQSKSPYAPYPNGRGWGGKKLATVININPAVSNFVEKLSQQNKEKFTTSELEMLWSFSNGGEEIPLKAISTALSAKKITVVD